MFKGLLTAIFCLPLAGCSSAEPAFEGSHTFAGKIEGNWEYGSFRECGTPAGCSRAFSTCGYDVSAAASADWKRLLPNERNNNYWVEFTGRKRTASVSEQENNLDPKDCVVEVLNIVTACESASPIYPDESGKMPKCASARSRR